MNPLMTWDAMQDSQGRAVMYCRTSVLQLSSSAGTKCSTLKDQLPEWHLDKRHSLARSIGSLLTLTRAAFRQHLTSMRESPSTVARCDQLQSEEEEHRCRQV